MDVDAPLEVSRRAKQRILPFQHGNYYVCLPGLPLSFSAFFNHRSVPRVQQTPRFRELSVKEDGILTSSSRPGRKTLKRPRKNKNKKKKKGGEKPENAAWPSLASPSTVPLRPTSRGGRGQTAESCTNECAFFASSPRIHCSLFVTPVSEKKGENRGKNRPRGLRILLVNHTIDRPNDQMILLIRRLCLLNGPEYGTVFLLYLSFV